MQISPLVCAALVAVAFAGCSDPAPLPVIDASEPVPCFVTTHPATKTQTLSPGPRYIHTPGGGYMRSGSAFSFRLNGMREHLHSVNVTVTWDSSGPQTEDRMLVWLMQEGDARPYLAFEGPTPLTLNSTIAPEINLERLRVSVSTTNNTGLMPASVALVDHEITVTVQQTYWC